MRELRIGLVLYGGVSLAVYMNGIVTELWRALQASQATAGASPPPLSGTAQVYAELLASLGTVPGTEKLRITVDTIAGTSAGGINGGVLARAIVKGGNAAILNTVWIEKADIALLKAEPRRAPAWIRFIVWLAGMKLSGLRKKIKDLPGLSWEWVRDTVWTLSQAEDQKTTPLDGTYFSRMIAQTYRDMETSTGPSLLPEGSRFDLFLTRTDLLGWPRHLPVSAGCEAQPLYERTHAHVMAFGERPPRGQPSDEFALTFASRTTAGFPIAFAPVSYDDLVAAYCDGPAGVFIPSPQQFAATYFRENQLFHFPVETALMVDGGLLDNKPFSYVARAIERKPADHKVYRMLVYVEPDPEGPVEPPRGRPAHVPGPVAWSALRPAASRADLYRPARAFRAQ